MDRITQLREQDYHAGSRISNVELKLENAVVEMMETLGDLGISALDAADAVRGIVGDKLNETMGLA